MKGKRIGFFSGILILCLLALIYVLPGTAEAEKSYSIPGEKYELPDTSEYKISEGKSVDKFFYGAKGMGFLCVTGTVDEPITYNGFTAYGTNGSVSIHYQYNGAYMFKDVHRWYVDDDGMGKVNGYDFGGLFKGVGHGCIIIEKSSDGKTWNKIQNPILNYFTEKKDSNKSLIYNIPEFEIKNGCYYRVLVAYRFCRKTGDGIMWIGDKYEYKKCMEVYTFYVSSEKNYVTVNDMTDGKTLTDKYTVQSGFVIRRNGSQATVSVVGKEEDCKDYAYYTDPGDYEIVTVTKLGKVYHLNLTVTDGMDFTPVHKKIYESEKDKGFPLNKTVSVPAFGSELTSLSLATPKKTKVKQKDSSYGITGQSTSLYLQVNSNKNMAGWWLESDSWGGRSKELVSGVMTGTVGKGALIIQTSADGKNWENVDKGRYAKGLYTTDFAGNYGKDENVLIYTPRGDDVLNGVYIRVLFAYQVKKLTADEYRDYVEAYQFYLCFDDVGAVTFHNLSVEETMKESFADEDQNTVEVYKKAETLVDGSYTTTGFVIDKTGNPTVKYTVLCNGVSVNGNQDRYDESGKYEITLTSVVDTSRKLTLYVDCMDPEEAMKRYFGDGFISGKRIFSEGEYPVYEGSELNWHVAEVDNNVLPLCGKITNISTGSTITIEQSSEEKTGIISEPGEYQAVFATSEEVFTGDLVGDARVFTFRFRVIAQGTAPGPVVNRKLLDDYSHSTVTDCNPVYYGLTYSSAGKGNITLAFATKEAAIEYAYNYEKGTVEIQDNGGYRYTGSFLVDQKIKFDSNWDLTDAVNYFAEAAVHKHFFDMSDEFTYLSLTTEILDKYPNLRQLELPRSITIFADNQKEMLTETEALPLLNDKPYAYLDPETGEEERGFSCFEFITDQYGGIDSKTVTITDCEGRQHIIRYSESVGKQLLAEQCPSGIVTVREETMYGDSVEYQAVYIAPGENQTELILEYSQNEDKKTIVCKGSEDGKKITADSFRIMSLADPNDLCAFVVINHKQHEEVYTAKDSIDTVWSDPGKYSITCLNRMGYGYTVWFSIEGAEATELTQGSPDTAAQLTTLSTASVNEKSTVLPESANASEEQSLQSVSLKIEDDIAEQSSGQNDQNTSNNNTLVIIGISLILLISLIVLVWRRIRLFSRAAESMKSEGENKHE